MVLCGTKNGSSVALRTFWSIFIFKSVDKKQMCPFKSPAQVQPLLFFAEPKNVAWIQWIWKQLYLWSSGRGGPDGRTWAGGLAHLKAISNGAGGKAHVGEWQYGVNMCRSSVDGTF